MTKWLKTLVLITMAVVGLITLPTNVGAQGRVRGGVPIPTPNTNAMPAVFVSELKRDTIVAFDSQARQVLNLRIPTGGPIAADKEGHLYVATYLNKPYVTVLSPPKYVDNPIRINLSNHFLAVGVIVNARTSDFAIVARQEQFYGGASLVSFYRHGETSACKTLFNSNGINDFDGEGAYDRSGTLFLAINNQSGDTLASIAGSCAAHSVEQLTFDQPIIPLSSGLGFNADDNLVVQPYNTQSQVYTYSHPKSGKFGLPIVITTLQPKNGVQVFLVGISSDGHHLWATAPKDIGLYAYPEGGKATTLLQGIREPERLTVLPPFMP